MMGAPFVSVIVPVYNVAEYIERCIQSICEQSYQNLEIILVDDGSTDRSGFICDRYAQADARIQVIHQENAGLVSARKAGITASHGQYIGFVDGDDYIEPDMYECLLEQIGDADFIHTWFYENDAKTVLHEEAVIELTPEKTCEIIHHLLIGSEKLVITPSIWSKLFRAELIRNCYFLVPDEQSYGEDVLCLFAVLCESRKAVLATSAYYHYTVRKSSLSHAIEQSGIHKEISLHKHLCHIMDRYGLLEYFDGELNYFLERHIFHAFRKLKNPFAVEQYSFGELSFFDGKRILLYGAGDVGKDYYSVFCRYKRCEVIAWVDRNYDIYDLAEVEAPEIINMRSYDFVVIAVLSRTLAGMIMDELAGQGVPRDKLIWRPPRDTLLQDRYGQFINEEVSI